MIIAKIVDSTYNYGRAEQYIDINADFERFLRNKYSLSQIKDISPIKIIEKFNLKGLVFGNYVTQEERFFFLFKIKYQLEALSKIAGKNNLGKGLLIIGFGVEGKAKSLAHYNPHKHFINLNRGRKGNYIERLQGESSFVHEFAHFIDCLQGLSDKKTIRNFGSEAVDSSNRKTLKFVQVTDIVYSDREYFSKLETPYLKERIEIFARLFEATIRHYVHSDLKTHKKFFDRNYTEKIYYPESKIKEKKITSRIISILKNS